MIESVQTSHLGGKNATVARQTAKKQYFVGIDPGVNTGVSLWDAKNKLLIVVETMTIHKAFKFVEICIENWGLANVHVRCEDARLRKWFGNAGREQLQGAGSIKRDSKIWDDYLADTKLTFEMVAPKANKTKLNAAQFLQITKYKGRTSEHARDATMLVFGM